MSRAVSIAKYTRRLESAIREGAWTGVESALERLRELLVEAIGGRAGAEIEEIKLALSSNRARLLALHEVEPIRDAKAMAWMLAADTGTSAIAADMASAASQVSIEKFQDAGEKILRHLATCPPQTTAEIAENLNYSRETVSRALTELRNEGLIATVPVGRQRMHRITAQGKTRVLGTRSDSPARLNRTVTEILSHSTPKHPSERLIRTDVPDPQIASYNRPDRESVAIDLFTRCISSSARTGRSDDFFSTVDSDSAPIRIHEEYRNSDRRPARFAKTGV